MCGCVGGCLFLHVCVCVRLRDVCVHVCVRERGYMCVFTNHLTQSMHVHTYVRERILCDRVCVYLCARERERIVQVCVSVLHSPRALHVDLVGQGQLRGPQLVQTTSKPERRY